MTTISNRYWKIQINKPYKVEKETKSSINPLYWLEGNGKVYLLSVTSSEVKASQVDKVGSRNQVAQGSRFETPSRRRKKDGDVYDFANICKVEKIDPQYVLS